ncbi:RND family efflux transporter, MFP subunit [Caminicella sporogenes DSM 14501]|uniref:RND family efflux transporter, MFP subunit n=1 Tax=Caminicella sporogenes DSM 14501 TaxID=1121266 RepID=A0A1M6PBB9_9FIRM|nr:efflux RND transporter periplasmic adaptor subunit [Caminicella sporogenes]RKD21464.1 hypothetical protein BET04_08485 [Caminicella sporogenes]SHK05236.1 RND family efflux transporter, MFP subunit [Caminicella sporogenes DSM 14501]
MKRKKTIVIFVLAISIVMMLFSIIAGKNINKTDSEDVYDKSLGIATELITAQRGKLIEEIKYIGTIDSEKSIILSPIISSDVSLLNVKEGDRVEKGDLIAKLDDSSLIQKLETNLKKLETAKENFNYLNKEVSQYFEFDPIIKEIEKMKLDFKYLSEDEEEYRILLENGAISKNDYDKIKHEKDRLEIQIKELEASSRDKFNKLEHERDISQMQLKELQAMINEIKKEIEETEIIAPRAGIIRKLYYEEGDLAIAGKPFAVIDENSFVAKVNITETDLKKISNETKVILQLADDRKVEARISKFPTIINPSTRICEVEIKIPEIEENQNIIIGSSIEVDFIINEVEGNIILPKEAIKKLGNKNIVYVFEDGKVREQAIEIGIEVDDKVQVLSGIDVNEKIAYKNLTKLYNGAKVYIFKGRGDN